MNSIKKIALSTLAAAFLLSLTSCAPEVGSDVWCTDMKAKPKTNWTAGQTTDFAKSCIFK